MGDDFKHCICLVELVFFAQSFDRCNFLEYIQLQEQLSSVSHLCQVEGVVQDGQTHFRENSVCATGQLVMLVVSIYLDEVRDKVKYLFSWN